jgi:nitrogen-specific signal transduction histidine kinase
VSESAFDALPLGAAVLAAGRITQANPAFARVVRATPEEVAGWGLDVLLGPEEAAALIEPDETAPPLDQWRPVAGIAPDGAPWIGELMLQTDGSATDGLLVLAAAGPPLEIEGRPPAASPVHDCPWQTFGIDRLLSHDVRGGLRGVTSFLTLLGREIGADLSGNALEYFETASAAATRTDVMTERLVALLRLSLRPAVLAPVQVRDIVDVAVARSAEAFEGPPAEVVVAELPAVWAAAGHLTDCLAELITNARKFAEAPVKVTVSLDHEVGPWVYLWVTDDGPGVDPEFAEDAFQPFRLLQPKGRFPGVGIGLTMCREIMRLQGGRCWIEPVVPPGTAVALRLARA